LKKNVLMFVLVSGPVLRRVRQDDNGKCTKTQQGWAEGEDPGVADKYEITMITSIVLLATAPSEVVKKPSFAGCVTPQ
jgi:hypothetical protein